eukprot:gene20109-22080_t
MNQHKFSFGFVYNFNLKVNWCPTIGNDIYPCVVLQTCCGNIYNPIENNIQIMFFNPKMLVFFKDFRTLSTLKVLLMVLSHDHNKLDTVRESIVISTAHVRRSGITKRAILIGDRVCGKRGFADKNRPLKITKREDTVDIDSIVSDLHSQAVSGNRSREEIPSANPFAAGGQGPAKVISKVSNKPQWFERLNRCCIDHEECNKFIPAKQERYNYKNEREYTIYDCKCDDSFAECLKYADSYTADAVGDLYFNVLKMPCINFQDQNAENGGPGTAVTKPTEKAKNIIDKLKDILNKEEPTKSLMKGSAKTVSSGKVFQGSQEEGMKENGDNRSSTLPNLDDEGAAAKERQAKHFNRNGHT